VAAMLVLSAESCAYCIR